MDQGGTKQQTMPHEVASPNASDHGFSLIETLVAMMIFAIVAASTSLVLLNSMNTAHANSMRTRAASVANTYIEQVRNTPPGGLTDGVETVTVTERGQDFTVKRTVGAQNQPTTLTGECNTRLTVAGSAFKAVRVEVTWAGMGSIKPIVNDALITATALNAAGKGIVVQKVLGAGGVPIAGAQVTLGPMNATTVTDAQGCAVFTEVVAPAGGLPVTTSATKANHVTAAGQATATQQFTAAGGVITVAPPLELLAMVDGVRFTLAADVTGGHNPLPFPVKVGMKSGSSPGIVLPKCVAGNNNSCVENLGLPQGSVVTGNNLAPTDQRFFATACDRGSDHSVSATVATLTSGQTVTIPLTRVEVSMISSWGTPDSGSRFELMLNCGPGKQTLGPVRYGAIGGGKHVMWLPPGEYILEKYWLLMRQNTETFTVSQAGNLAVSIQG